MMNNYDEVLKIRKAYRRKRIVRRIIGVLIILVAITGIIYGGVYLMLIKGIIQCIEAAKADWDTNRFALGLVRAIIGTPVVSFIGNVALAIGFRLT